MSEPRPTGEVDGPDPADPTEPTEPTDIADPADAADEVVAFARRISDLARSGDHQLLAYLDAGAPVSLTSASGDTLLMLAAYHGQAALVGALAARGADVDAVNDRGQSPLAGAVFKKETAVVAVLLAAGADPALGTPSAIETAHFFENAELVALLEG